MANRLNRFFTISVLAISVSLGAGFPAAAEDDFSKFWTIEELFSGGIPQDKVLYHHTENGSTIGEPSFIQTLDAQTNAGMSLCAQIGTAPCDAESLLGGKVHFYAPVVLPLCETSVSADCVESLTLVKQNGEPVQAEFLKMVQGATYLANSKFSFPATGKQLLFRAPGVIHAGGTDTYAVEYVQTLEWINSTKPLYRDLKVAVVPYVEKPDPTTKTMILRPGPGPDGKGEYTLDPWNYPFGAIWAENGSVGKIANFSAGTGAKVVIRAHKGFGGWFRGRLSNAQFDSKSFSSDQQRITIGGSSVEVPRVAGIANEEQYKKFATEPIFFFENHKGGGVGGDASDPEGRFTWLNLIREVTKDKAPGVNRTWMFATVAMNKEVSCYNTPGVQGLIATNAAVYAGSAPNFESGALNYKVGGLHYLPNGSEAIGSYDLVMRSDIARCLYGFSKAPLSATVSITGGDSPTVATTVLNEKNGWINLAAKGFTFSTKDIKVKFSQKKVTISCVAKANQRKLIKVTAYSPVCPRGYVKK